VTRSRIGLGPKVTLRFAAQVLRSGQLVAASSSIQTIGKVFVGGAEEGVNNFHVRPMTTAMRTVGFFISECCRASIAADEGAELTVDFP